MVEDDIDITFTEIEHEDQSPEPASNAARSHTMSGLAQPKHVKEEVEVSEVVMVEKESSRSLRTLLTGAPDPSSMLLSLLTFLVNFGLVLATIDLVYHAKVFHPSTELSFARMGYM